MVSESALRATARRSSSAAEVCSSFCTRVVSRSIPARYSFICASWLRRVDTSPNNRSTAVRLASIACSRSRTVACSSSRRRFFSSMRSRDWPICWSSAATCCWCASRSAPRRPSRTSNSCDSRSACWEGEDLAVDHQFIAFPVGGALHQVAADMVFALLAVDGVEHVVGALAAAAELLRDGVLQIHAVEADFVQPALGHRSGPEIASGRIHFPDAVQVRLGFATCQSAGHNQWDHHSFYEIAPHDDTLLLLQHDLLIRLAHWAVHVPQDGQRLAVRRERPAIG